jgi:hypothetical protein
VVGSRIDLEIRLRSGKKIRARVRIKGRFGNFRLRRIRIIKEGAENPPPQVVNMP